MNRETELADGAGSVPAAAHRPPTRQTVLVVEDDNVVRFVVRETLRRAGYTLLEARDGKEAVFLAEEYDGPIQLQVTDVIFPRMDGPSLPRQIVASRPGLRTLYMSGHDDEALSRRGMPSAGDYLEKPFTRETLTRRVRELLEA